MNEQRERAKGLLLHYFELAGVDTRRDHDLVVEIHQIVDEIIDQAVHEAKQACRQLIEEAKR